MLKNEGKIKERKVSVFTVCLPEAGDIKRRFMLAAYDLQMTTEEYVYLFAGPKSTAYRK